MKGQAYEYVRLSSGSSSKDLTSHSECCLCPLSCSLTQLGSRACMYRSTGKTYVRHNETNHICIQILGEKGSGFQWWAWSRRCNSTRNLRNSWATRANCFAHSFGLISGARKWRWYQSPNLQVQHIEVRFIIFESLIVVEHIMQSIISLIKMLQLTSCDLVEVVREQSQDRTTLCWMKRWHCM